MNRLERVEAALRDGEVDHPPISFWGHDYVGEWSASGLAEAMLDNYRTFGWDYMKVNPRASYHVEDWGAELKPSGDPNTGPVWIHPAVTTATDWRTLRPLEPDRGVLSEQLEALRLIRDGLAGEAYFIQTIFSPLSIAKYLVGNDPAPVKAMMSDDPGSLRAALDVITETFITYSLASLEAGASGIFFATTGWATKDMLSEDEYRRWGCEYDLRVLDAVKDRAPFNVLHNCGAGIYFDLLADYPVHAISWAATLPGNPSLADGLARTQKAVMGGISEKTTLPNGTPEDVANEVRQALAETKGVRLLLAPGCSIPPRTPPANLAAAAQAARNA
ncbi:MAG TPA: uroporphyrinogen decarboxylase family protein [Ktedonobacterales bacterium]|jgi:uroporphyrinogen decarboxylase|nr:uroporphyrinogen decarboxylase family protein [Ktedonobacterales bacterium]